MTRLRPVQLGDVDTLTRWRVDPVAAGEFQWVGFAPDGRLREEVAAGTVIGPDGGTLAVVDEHDTVLGDVGWRRQSTGPAYDSWCWSIGIVLLPEHRGRGHGGAAQRQLAAYLFDHTVAERVQADTDVDNVAEQRALEGAGFSREGLLRRAQWRRGGWHDMAAYSKLRGEG